MTVLINAAHIQDKFDTYDDAVKEKISKDFIGLELILNDKRWLCVFQSTTFTECLMGIVVDEAHCIKKWYIRSCTV